MNFNVFPLFNITIVIQNSCGYNLFLRQKPSDLHEMFFLKFSVNFHILVSGGGVVHIKLIGCQSYFELYK